MQRLVDEVQAAGMEPGEEGALRRALRQLDGRRAAAERCRLVSVGLGGGGGGGGIAEALRDVELQVKQLLSQEERRLAAAAAAEREEGSSGGGGLGEADAEGQEGDEAAAALLQASVGLLGRAQELLDEAEGKASLLGGQHQLQQKEGER
jgi:NAD(P)H-hydrate repair Nnr-like enzyme with NAD(P)H-hydrate epimerase domain